ncbi:peptide chain release factor N(5)-glutamine methyltransferase [Sphingobacterium corticibacter]|uniref:Release factor glutamine methyltransferase n=1 Tax=Sphingobacterium corticibacter TaxID=2171749 RepID=A0A2T8HGB2_9SPHI|nr:peptide chain release factor N(5)-glutamine methyltransferase [Sphingobacterium corticibacter]PVH24476.1 peptide chain release factor N(5)-glutamine methyltransferase [Sphingobacterium corticibacter]
MQTLHSLRTTFGQHLAEIYPAEEIDSLFYIVAAETLSISRLQVKMNLHLVVNDLQLAEFQRVLNALQGQMPIQHILGHAPFYGFEFEVNEHTLIPRPETEELVHLIITQEKYRKQAQVLDIGTGSGCIAISLAKKLPHANVEAMDISTEALAVAQRNAEKLDAAVRFTQFDILNWRKWEGESRIYDVIVSNPPYITPTEKSEMSNQVLEHEPHSALFVEESDPLIFYREIAAFAARCLAADGALYFEINQYLAVETKAIVEAQGFSQVQILEDINGAKRMLYCRR